MGIKLSDFIKDPHNVFTQEEAEMIYLASDYVDLGNEYLGYIEASYKRLREALEFYASGNHYLVYDDKIILSDDGEIARKALEGEELKTLVSVTFNGTSSEHIFDVPKDEFKVMWNEQIEQVGYFESIDTEGRTVIINPKQCPVIVMYDLND